MAGHAYETPGQPNAPLWPLKKEYSKLSVLIAYVQPITEKVEKKRKRNET